MQEQLSSKTEVAHFDNLAHDYKATHDRAIKLAGGDSDFFYKSKINHLESLLDMVPRRILDYGGGTGRLTKLLHSHYDKSDIVLYDPSKESIEVAKHECKSDDRLTIISEGLEEQEPFDLVVAAGVFHHIPRKYELDNLKVLYNLLNPGGKVVVFEHNPVCPHAQLLIALAGLDKDATFIRAGSMKKMMSQVGFTKPISKYISFLPSSFTLLHPLETWLDWFPLGAQYVAMASKN